VDWDEVDYKCARENLKITSQKSSGSKITVIQMSLPVFSVADVEKINKEPVDTQLLCSVSVSSCSS